MNFARVRRSLIGETTVPNVSQDNEEKIVERTMATIFGPLCKSCMRNE